MHKLFDIICKPPLIAARMGLLLVMTLCVMLPCHAQDGLAVNGIFQQYGHSKGCKMVVMQNAKLRRALHIIANMQQASTTSLRPTAGLLRRFVR